MNDKPRYEYTILRLAKLSDVARERLKARIVELERQAQKREAAEEKSIICGNFSRT